MSQFSDTFPFSSRLVLAPIAGYTDIPFRRIARAYGAGIVYTELISAEGIVRFNRKTFNLMKIDGKEHPVGIQLFGKDPVVMAEAASIAESLSPDLIDINFGCCAPTVCRGDSGAALLKNPDLLNRIASSIVARVRTPVSAKIRIGWDDHSKNYNDIVKILINAGISMITVHGRTRAQKYTGHADWEIISEIASLSSVPVIGNGDIVTYEDALSRLRTSGCAAVMIGRGAIGNPWIFSGETPSITDRIDCAERHFNDMVAYYGDYGMILSRKHMVHYLHHFKNVGTLRASIVKARTPDEVRALFSEYKYYIRALGTFLDCHE
jgi:tRNA-dihydrouridine synthase B